MRIREGDGFFQYLVFRTISNCILVGHPRIGRTIPPGLQLSLEFYLLAFGNF